MRIFFSDIIISLQNIRKNKTTSSATILSTTSALFILAIVLIILLNVNNFVNVSKEKFYNIQIFFTADTSREQIDNLEDELKKIFEFESIIFKSKQESMDEFKERFGDDSSLFEDIENPLTDSLILELKTFDDAKNIENFLNNKNIIEDIEYFEDEINYMENLSAIVSIAGFVIILLLFFIILFVIINTIKIAVYSREKEINIMKYIGATNWYIRRPFLYEGMILGLISAMIATGISILIYFNLHSVIINNPASLFSESILTPDVITRVLLICILSVGAGVGAIGSLVSMRNYLRV